MSPRHSVWPQMSLSQPLHQLHHFKADAPNQQEQKDPIVAPCCHAVCHLEQGALRADPCIPDAGQRDPWSTFCTNRRLHTVSQVQPAQLYPGGRQLWRLVLQNTCISDQCFVERGRQPPPPPPHTCIRKRSNANTRAHSYIQAHVRMHRGVQIRSDKHA
jgi:hypothetical protein